MQITLPLFSSFTLKIVSSPPQDNHYPTAKIQKGMILFWENEELCEEAVGFGVPILKRGLETIFPSRVELTFPDTNQPRKIHARYKIDLIERIAKPNTGAIHSPILYKCKNILAGLIRSSPALRSSLTRTSNLLRASLAWETTYEPGLFSTHVSVTYNLDVTLGKLKIELASEGHYPAGVSEIVLMNEQGAHHFDRYRDSDGISQSGTDIGCWDQVTAREASFSSLKHQISFSQSQVPGAKLFRGREVDGSRLAWSGFGYSFPPSLEHFSYEITLKRY